MISILTRSRMCKLIFSCHAISLPHYHPTVQLCSFPTVLKHIHLPVGSYSERGWLFSIKSRAVVGFEALIKDHNAGLDIVVRVIPKLEA